MEGANGKLLFSGVGVSVWEEDEILEMNGGDGSTVWTHFLPLDAALRWLKRLNVVFCISYLNV